MTIDENIRDFYDCVKDLINTEEVQRMRSIHHHPGISCYHHSVFVAYVTFRLARKWGMDYVSVTQAALLHDLYLYDPKDRSQYYGNQIFAHPEAALRNAWVLCGSLSPQQEDAIRTHMWPLAKQMPHCKEAALVNFADKFCASLEVLGLYHLIRKMKRCASSPHVVEPGAL